MGTLFFPPKPNPWVIGTTHLLGEPVAKLLYRLHLKVMEENINRLQQLKQERVIYLVNHPSFNDPIPVMLLSARVKKGFYYMASVEQFGGVMGAYFQSIGTYSVRRGQGDRPSMKQTLSLLSQPQTHLVVFAEGGCSFQNDTVMPFRPGALQLAFQAMKRMQKEGQGLPSIHVVPLALKYQYRGNALPHIDSLLKRLESKLSLQASQSRYQRLRKIAIAVMEKIEREYGFETVQKEGDLSQVVQQLKQKLIEHCEQVMGIKANPNFSIRERIYQVEGALASEQPEGMTSEEVRKAIFRLFNFNAMADGYVAKKPTPERFMDVLVRLEREVFEIDRPKFKGDRWAHLRVGDSFDLKDFWTDYERDRRQTIEQLTLRAQRSVQSQLNQIPASAIDPSAGLGE